MLDPRYVVARTVLLDALDALGEQRSAVIVVGAQAVCMHTGAIDLAVAEFTLDADITIDPALLHDVPEIEAAMLGARFERSNRVGVWVAWREVAGVPARGGYPWTVIPVDRRNDYMRALESASVKQDIEPFAEFIAGLVQDRLDGTRAPGVPML